MNTDRETAMESVQFEHEGKTITLFTNGKDDHLFKQFLLHKNFYEMDLLQKIRDIYVPGSVIVDVGANIGNHTVFFSKIMGAPVLAFEPFSVARDILMRNIQANECININVSELALGEINGTASAGMFDPRNIGTVCVSPDTSGELTMGRLDDLVPPSKHIGIMKIDVEGGELGVLRGAENLIRRHRPDLFIEAHTELERDQLEAFLAPLSYRNLRRYCATPTYWFGSQGR